MCAVPVPNAADNQACLPCVLNTLLPKICCSVHLACSAGAELVTPALEEMYARRFLLDAASKANVTLYKPGEPLGVCIFTADFWGSPTAGGTATAYHLLAQVPYALET